MGWSTLPFNRGSSRRRSTTQREVRRASASYEKKVFYFYEPGSNIRLIQFSLSETSFQYDE